MTTNTETTTQPSPLDQFIEEAIEEVDTAVLAMALAHQDHNDDAEDGIQKELRMLVEQVIRQAYGWGFEDGRQVADHLAKKGNDGPPLPWDEG